MQRIDVIIPSFHSRDMTAALILSMEKFNNGFEFRYIVVENSDDVSYRDDILSISPSICWVQNPTELVNSEANAIALEKGLEYATTDYVFLAHCDTIAIHQDWMKYWFGHVNETTPLVGFRADAFRIGALHSSGILVKTDIARAVSLFPVYENNEMVLDVTDSLTQYCRDNQLNFVCLRNTFNDKTVREELPENIAALTVDIVVNEKSEPIFMHLGRGITRLFGRYNKVGRTSYKEWFEFIVKEVLQ